MKVPLSQTFSCAFECYREPLYCSTLCPSWLTPGIQLRSCCCTECWACGYLSVVRLLSRLWVWGCLNKSHHHSAGYNLHSAGSSLDYYWRDLSLRPEVPLQICSTLLLYADLCFIVSVPRDPASYFRLHQIDFSIMDPPFHEESFVPIPRSAVNGASVVRWAMQDLYPLLGLCPLPELRALTFL